MARPQRWQQARKMFVPFLVLAGSMLTLSAAHAEDLPRTLGLRIETCNGEKEPRPSLRRHLARELKHAGVRSVSAPGDTRAVEAELFIREGCDGTSARISVRQLAQANRSNPQKDTFQTATAHDSPASPPAAKERSVTLPSSAPKHDRLLALASVEMLRSVWLAHTQRPQRPQIPTDLNPTQDATGTPRQDPVEGDAPIAASAQASGKSAQTSGKKEEDGRLGNDGATTTATRIGAHTKHQSSRQAQARRNPQPKPRTQTKQLLSERARPKKGASRKTAATAKTQNPWQLIPPFGELSYHLGVSLRNFTAGDLAAGNASFIGPAFDLGWGPLLLGARALFAGSDSDLGPVDGRIVAVSFGFVPLRWHAERFLAQLTVRSDWGGTWTQSEPFGGVASSVEVTQARSLYVDGQVEMTGAVRLAWHIWLELGAHAGYAHGYRAIVRGRVASTSAGALWGLTLGLAYR